MENALNPSAGAQQPGKRPLPMGLITEARNVLGVPAGTVTEAAAGQVDGERVYHSAGVTDRQALNRIEARRAGRCGTPPGPAISSRSSQPLGWRTPLRMASSKTPATTSTRIVRAERTPVEPDL